MTAPLANLDKKIRDLEAAADDVRSATRAAHEATKDLKAVIREARELLSSKPVEDRIDQAVAAGLEHYTTTIKAKTDEATAAVFRRYDEIVVPMLGALEQLRDAGIVEKASGRPIFGEDVTS